MLGAELLSLPDGEVTDMSTSSVSESSLAIHWAGGFIKDYYGIWHFFLPFFFFGGALWRLTKGCLCKPGRGCLDIII